MKALWFWLVLSLGGVLGLAVLPFLPDTVQVNIGSIQRAVEALRDRLGSGDASAFVLESTPRAISVTAVTPKGGTLTPRPTGAPTPSTVPKPACIPSKQDETRAVNFLQKGEATLLGQGLSTEQIQFLKQTVITMEDRDGCSSGIGSLPPGVPAPTPTPTKAPTPILAPTLKASATQSAPTSAPQNNLAELRLYVLELVNSDRAKAGLRPVKLGTNTAAQAHAEDMLAKFYIGHIDSGGMKPYMRYSLAGGLGAVGENASYSGTEDPNDRANYVRLDPRKELGLHEYQMMYDDASSNWGHRDNILSPEHQYVNIGIAYTSTRLAMIQHFEETYVTFVQVPKIQGGLFTMACGLDASVGKLRSVDIYYDPTPKPYDHSQLTSQPHSYGTGTNNEPVLHLIPPPTAGYFYTGLDPSDVVASTWGGPANYSVTANLGARVSAPGVYTILLWGDQGGFPLTTFSIFVP